MKKLRLLLISFVIAMGIFAMSSTNAEAAKPRLECSSTMLLNKSPYAWFSPGISGVPYDKCKILKTASTNTKVILAGEVDHESNSASFRTVGVGKSTISVKIKYKKNKYVLKKKIEVVDDKPFKTIKYNGKEVYKGNEYKDPTVYSYKSGKKIEWKLKKGYKIIQAYTSSFNPETGDSTIKNIKSGSKVKIYDYGITLIYFRIKTPENKEIEYFINAYLKEK